MPVIKHGDREIRFEYHDVISHIKLFHQDYIPFGSGTDYAVHAVSAGKAREDMESLGDNHIKTFSALKPFLEEPPKLIPSYDYIIYDGREKKFPFMDIISAGILASNQLIISYRFLGFLQKYRMAPFITAPVVVKHRDTFIEDYYVMVYFWHHGCDLVDWKSTVFAWVDSMIFQNIEKTFTMTFEMYKELRRTPPKDIYIPISITINSQFDIFKTNLSMHPFVSNELMIALNENKFKNLWISNGDYFETIMKT